MAGDKPLWAPWRIDYILGEKPDGCVFCVMPLEGDDRRNRILMRGKTCFVVMNMFPYNNGHLMIVPYRHICDYSELSDEELEESARMTKTCVTLIKKTMRPDGFNVGVNLGKAAGAGIDEHLHIHIVPRWNGDNNYMAVIGQTKVIPQHLWETYDLLAEGLKEK